MTIEPTTMYTRSEVAIIFKCGYRHARTIYRNIYLSIPYEKRVPEHERTLPGNIILEYIQALPIASNQPK